MEKPSVGILDYQSVLEKAGDRSPEAVTRFLLEELPYLWRDAYLEITARPTNIVRFKHGAFEYIYDDYPSLEASGTVPCHATAEARLVAVIAHLEACSQAWWSSRSTTGSQ